MGIRARTIGLLTGCAAAAVLLAPLNGQGTPRPNPPNEVRENLEQRMNTMRNLDTLARREAEMANRENLRARIYRPVLSKSLQRRLEIPPELVSAHGELLASGEAGIVTLVAQAKCDKFKRISKLADCYQENANIREYANAFSFREMKRVIYGKSDIGVSGDFLVGGRHSVQTMIVALEQTTFADLSPDSEEISYLFNFRPFNTPEGMDQQYEDIRLGLSVANYSNGSIGSKLTYAKTAKIEKGKVYALRAIAYRSSQSSSTEKDHDVIVALKVLDIDDDGGATILWRVIERKPGQIMKEEPTTPDAN